MISCLFFGFFVFSKNPSKRLYQLWLLFSAAVALWGLAAFRLGQIPESHKELAVLWWRITYLGIIFIPVFLYHFIYTWLGLKRKIFLYCFYLWGLFFFILEWTPWADLFFGAKTVTYVFSTAYIVRPATQLFTFFVLCWVGIVFYSHYELYKAFKGAVGVRKNQIQYFFLGIAIAFIGGGATFLIPFGVDLYPGLNFAVPLYPAIMAYAIVRYQLLDIKIVITRAGIFGLVYALVLGVPYLIGLRLLGPGKWVVPVNVMAVLATLGPFLYQYLRKRAEGIILRQQHRYQNTLKALSKRMTQVRDLDKLIKLIILTVADTVKVDFAAIYLKDEADASFKLKGYYPKRDKARFRELFAPNADLINAICIKRMPVTAEELEAGGSIAADYGLGLIIPCFFEEDLLGFMILGPKPNRQMYTSEDTLVFETLSYATSLAIENCRFWREVEDRQRKARLQEMDAYSYSLAHEIDNPVQIILGESGLLKNEFVKHLSDETRRAQAEESFNFIIESAERIAGMVKAVRDFGKKTTGKFVPLKIEEVIESFTSLYFPRLKGHGIVLERRVDELLREVYLRGEKADLLQVLVILANNSIHAMRYSQEKKIIVEARMQEPGSVLLSFSDTGSGIKKALLPMVFSSFVTTKASSEGTGMGLYNAKRIVELHKGNLWAESEGENKGATFFIRLPVATDINQEEETKRVF